jgi:hypothetical protein
MLSVALSCHPKHLAGAIMSEHSTVYRTTQLVHWLIWAATFLLVLSFASNAENCTNAPVSGQLYSIINHGSGKALDISGNSRANGGNLIQRPYKDGSNQQFYLNDLGNGYWSIQASHSGLVLNVALWSVEKNTNILQWDYYGAKNQQWEFKQTLSGDFNIISSQSGQSITVGNDSDGANVYQKNDIASPYQRWYLNPVNGNCNRADNDAQTCEKMDPAADYGAPGPFPKVEIVRRTGPWRNYTLFRPAMGSLGANGFKHPIATWGNGILTTPNEYKTLLTHIASHGFVVIACNDIQAERSCLNAGLNWLNEQNESGPMAGMLDTNREVSIGYSWGGGAAIDVANRPNMKATVSLHGMPPRETTAFEDMHSPLLLITSTGDSFVTKEKYVTPNYDKSRVQTFFATLNDSSVGHLYVVDRSSLSCLVSPLLGACGGAQRELAPTTAWLRMLACGDQHAREYFYGSECLTCIPPWTAEKKLWPTPDSP